jgi:predicted peptidase
MLQAAFESNRRYAVRLVLSLSAFMVLAFMSAEMSVAADAPSLRDRYQEREFADASGAKHRYRLLLPAGFREEDATKYPLVLFLHGAGERGNDNVAQLKHVAAEFARDDRQAEYPCIVICPQCPTEEKWVLVDWSDKSGASTFPDEPSPAMKAALGMVDEWIKGGRVDKSRVYITGLSMGGYGTWYAASMEGNPFAAAMPICGGGDPTWAKRYGSLPIWTFHGTEDAAVPLVRSQEMIDALKATGHQPEAKFTIYDGAGHDVWTETYKRDDVFAWLFSQKK